LVVWCQATAEKGELLRKAAADGDVVQVRTVLDGPEPPAVDARDKFGFTALIRACQGGHEGVVEELLDRGADAYAKLNSVDTALNLAAGKGHERVVRLLLDRGDDANLSTHSRWRALFVSSYNGHVGVVKLLLDQGAQATINATADDGRTALMGASCNSHVGVVKLLLDWGGDVTARHNGKTAEEQATNEDIKRLLRVSCGEMGESRGGPAMGGGWW
jgi:uncharacterized protein